MVEKQAQLVQVVESIEVGEIIRTTLQFDEMPTAPIAPALLQIKTESPRPSFELHCLVDRLDNSLVFITYDVDESPLISGNFYPFYSLWTPNQLELAQDDGRHWVRMTFENQNMIAFKLEGGGTIGRKLVEGEEIKGGNVIRGGWEHEHCELCFVTISAAKGFQHDGFKDGSEWLCQACYEKYILSGFGKKLGDAS